jgi:hypothetical protein
LNTKLPNVVPPTTQNKNANLSHKHPANHFRNQMGGVVALETAVSAKRSLSDEIPETRYTGLNQAAVAFKNASPRSTRWRG